MKKISDLGEIRLIERFKHILRNSKHDVIAGIGDDAAVLKFPGKISVKNHMLFASDMLVQDVHFRLCEASPQQIGWKALACNISDIAAMGGEPCFAVSSIGLPKDASVAFGEGIYRGMLRCSKRFDVAVVGGDTVRSSKVVIDVAIIGEASSKHLVLRSGARKGDLVFVTGTLGGSLKSKKHLGFTPRLNESRFLVNNFPVHAMIDISDGLANDAWQIARSSRVNIELFEGRIPLSRSAKNVHNALEDGEDFELLFCVPASAAGKIPKRIGNVPISLIGAVTSSKPGVVLIAKTGSKIALSPGAFRHF